MRPLFTVTSIWVEPSSPSYFKLIVVHNDPRRSSASDARVEVTVCPHMLEITNSDFTLKLTW